MVKTKLLEHTIDKMLSALDPIIDPIVNRVRSGLAWLRNRFFKPKLPRPIVVTEAEFDTEATEQYLIVPA